MDSYYFSDPKAEISISTVHCICGPSSPGGVTIVATGTAGPFTFQWSGPEGYESTLQSPTDISVPGLYEVAVTNAYGCAAPRLQNFPSFVNVRVQAAQSHTSP